MIIKVLTSCEYSCINCRFWKNLAPLPEKILQTPLLSRHTYASRGDDSAVGFMIPPATKGEDMLRENLSLFSSVSQSICSIILRGS